MDPKKPGHALCRGVSAPAAVGQLIGGGPESGIYKTTDGGAKWTKLTKGLPDGRDRPHRPRHQLAEPEQRLCAGDRAARPGRVLPLRRRRRELDADRPHGQRPEVAGDVAALPARTPPPPASAGVRAGRSQHRRRRQPRQLGRNPPAGRDVAGPRRGRRLLSRRGSRLLQRDHRRRQRSRNDLVAADATCTAARTAGRTWTAGRHAGRPRRSPRHPGGSRATASTT